MAGYPVKIDTNEPTVGARLLCQYSIRLEDTNGDRTPYYVSRFRGSRRGFEERENHHVHGTHPTAKTYEGSFGTKFA